MNSHELYDFFFKRRKCQSLTSKDDIQYPEKKPHDFLYNFIISLFSPVSVLNIASLNISIQSLLYFTENW